MSSDIEDCKMVLKKKKKKGLSTNGVVAKTEGQERIDGKTFILFLL